MLDLRAHRSFYLGRQRRLLCLLPHRSSFWITDLSQVAWRGIRIWGGDDVEAFSSDSQEHVEKFRGGGRGRLRLAHAIRAGIGFRTQEAIARIAAARSDANSASANRASAGGATSGQADTCGPARSSPRAAAETIDHEHCGRRIPVQEQLP